MALTGRGEMPVESAVLRSGFHTTLLLPPPHQICTPRQAGTWDTDKILGSIWALMNILSLAEAVRHSF